MTGSKHNQPMTPQTLSRIAWPRPLDVREASLRQPHSQRPPPSKSTKEMIVNHPNAKQSSHPHALAHHILSHAIPLATDDSRD